MQISEVDEELKIKRVYERNYSNGDNQTRDEFPLRVFIQNDNVLEQKLTIATC